MTDQGDRQAAWTDEPTGNGVPDADTDPHMFMTAEGITRGDFSAALREYRALDTGWDASPWEQSEIGVLSTDFVNWYRWERL